MKAAQNEVCSLRKLQERALMASPLQRLAFLTGRMCIMLVPPAAAITATLLRLLHTRHCITAASVALCS